MAPPRHNKKQRNSLSAGRPTNIAKPNYGSPGLSAVKSRQVIRQHHTLNKAHAQALASGHDERAEDIEAQLEAAGGLKRYQHASKLGQSIQRGGDSSTVLVQWLNDVFSAGVSGVQSKLKMLEVGALSTENACSRSGLFDVTRIDLNAQSKGITKQDFMERPLPQEDEERFDCVSLSLVLNFVPSPKGRGEMLRWTTEFLKHGAPKELHDDNDGIFTWFPSLFLVLPAPCVTNSRYLSRDVLVELMSALGFHLQRHKLTDKLVYYLWMLDRDTTDSKAFPRRETRGGKSRNNFAIVLE